MITDIKLGFNGNSYQIKTDTKTVWINRRYGCVARFSISNVEMKVPDLNQPVLNLLKPNHGSWKKFQKLVNDWYGFELDDIWCPLWITEDVK